MSRTFKIHDKSVALILSKDDALFLWRSMTGTYTYHGKTYGRVVGKLEAAIEEVAPDAALLAALFGSGK